MLTVEKLYELYAHLQGQLAATTNLAAALAALSPDREALTRIIEATQTSTNASLDASTAAVAQAYDAGMAHAISVFRAAALGMSTPPQ